MDGPCGHPSEERAGHEKTNTVRFHLREDPRAAQFAERGSRRAAAPGWGTGNGECVLGRDRGSAWDDGAGDGWWPWLQNSVSELNAAESCLTLKMNKVVNIMSCVFYHDFFKSKKKKKIGSPLCQARPCPGPTGDEGGCP